MLPNTNSVLNKGSSKNNMWAWFLIYLLWPFGALIKSMNWLRTKEAMNLFWLFCIYYGFTFVVARGSLADSTRIIRHFQEMNASGLTLKELFDTLYKSGSSDLDIVQSLISFIVSRFTGDYRILYAVFALVFGYFYSRNIWLLINKTDIRIAQIPALILIAFAVVDGIWNINGFRYHTAVQIFMYGALSFFLEGKKHKLLFTVLAIFVHWSFMIALVLLLLYLIIKNRTRIYFILFTVSFFIATFEMDIIREWFESYAPPIIQESRSGYLDEGYQKGIDKTYLTANWYVKGHMNALKWFIFISFVHIYIRGIRKVKENRQLFNLFNFSLLFYAFVNILSNVPSMGRFYAVANMLSLAFIFLNLQMIQGNYSAWIKRIGVPLILIFIVVKIRMAFDFIGIYTLIGNPVSAWFVEYQIPLIDFIKKLL